MPVFCFVCEIYRADQHGPERLGPCPKCGSETTAEYPLGEEFRVRISGSRNRSIPPGKGRRQWQFQYESKHIVFHHTGRRQFVERAWNKRTNEYHERIIDVESGELVREVREPLTEHQGHGAARRRKAPE